MMAGAVALSASFTISASMQQDNYPNWTVHSSFDNQPRKIIDTPDAVYFLVHQGYYNPSTSSHWGYYSNPSNAVFIYDKENKSEGIQPLTSRAKVSGSDIKLMDYSPTSGSLVIAYIDGGIDVISPDHNTVYIDFVKKRVMPGASKINSINFDNENGDIWLGTGSGFVAIDGETLEIKNYPSWDDAVSAIVPVGDNVVALMGNKLYVSPRTANLNLRNSFTAMPLSGESGTMGTINALMPLGNDVFATLNSNGDIHWYAPDGNNWKATRWVSYAVSLSDNYYVNRTEHTVTPTAKGFYVAAKEYAYVLNRPEGNSLTPGLIRTTLPAGSTLYNASYDLNSYWFYTGPRKFAEYSLADGKWQQEATPAINAPLSMKDVYFRYSPEAGMVVVAKHPQQLCQDQNLKTIATVAAYKDGKWRDLTPAYNPPKIATVGSAALAEFNSLVSEKRWPVSTPVTAQIDPLNPNVLFLGSVFEGFSAIYLDDPTKTPFIVNGKQDTWGSNFNADHALPEKSTKLRGSYVLGTDTEGVLWVIYNPADGYSNSTDIFLYALTPEQRTASLQSGDTGQHFEMKKITHPFSLRGTWWHGGLVLNHPKNKNKILTTSAEGDSEGFSIRILDHKGTLDDTSDDTLTTIYNITDESGATYYAQRIYNFSENPLTGDIVLSTMFDTFILDLTEPVVNETAKCRTLTVTSENGASRSFRPYTRSVDSCFDDYGRLWVATEDYGVLGFSADGKSAVQYDMANSPLHSNYIHAVGWNSATKSLFVNSEGTVMEVKVDVPTELLSGEETTAFAVPAMISPEYGGTVALHNIPAGSGIRVRDITGKTVRELEGPVDGVAYWDLLDSEGRRVPSGKYEILDASGNDAFRTIILPVVR